MDSKASERSALQEIMDNALLDMRQEAGGELEPGGHDAPLHLEHRRLAASCRRGDAPLADPHGRQPEDLLVGDQCILLSTGRGRPSAPHWEKDAVVMGGRTIMQPRSAAYGTVVSSAWNHGRYLMLYAMWR